MSSPIKLAEFWPYQTVVLADLISRHTLKVVKEHGQLNLSQWRVLAAVAEEEGRMAASVVKVTPMDKGIVSRAVAWLIGNGLISRKTDPKDRRRSELFLTHKGRRQYNKIRQALILVLPKDPEFNKLLGTHIDNLRELMQD